MKDDTPPREPVALLMDGSCLQSITKGRGGSSGQPRFTLDYVQFVNQCFTLAGVSGRSPAYFFDSRPRLPRDQVGSTSANRELYREHAFHDAIRNRAIQVRLSDAPWVRSGCCGSLVEDQGQVTGDMLTMMARLVSDSPEVQHFILVSNKEALVPMALWVRTKGATVTLIYSEPGESEEFHLPKACTTSHYISREEMETMAYHKTS